jgi:hypothetical protein
VSGEPSIASAGVLSFWSSWSGDRAKSRSEDPTTKPSVKISRFSQKVVHYEDRANVSDPFAQEQPASHPGRKDVRDEISQQANHVVSGPSNASSLAKRHDEHRPSAVVSRDFAVL